LVLHLPHFTHLCVSELLVSKEKFYVECKVQIVENRFDYNFASDEQTSSSTYTRRGWKKIENNRLK
jgi:hypothetical protein